MRKLLIPSIISLFLFSCEDVIKVDLEQGESQLAVDGLIAVDDGPQEIRLYWTNPYFDNASPRPVSGAFVTLTSTGGLLDTLHESNTKPGYYEVVSLTGSIGEIFTLNISQNGENYRASSVLARGTGIDTLYQEFREPQFGNEAGNYLNFVARDSLGEGDFYWLRYSLNGQPNKRPGSLTIVADGAFAPGSADGLEFIFPIRNSINQNKPYLIGDTITVELLSIDFGTWLFMGEMQTQMNNVGLFADPPSNVRTNIENRDPSGKKAVGWFGVSRIWRKVVIIQ